MRHNQPIPPGKSRFRALPTTLAALLGLFTATLTTAPALRAAAPPTIYQAYVTAGNAPIQGGLALGNNGSLFFATLGASGINPQVIGLNSSHTQLWTPYSLNAGEKVYGSPSVSPDGTKLYFGTDHGRLICLSTATGLPLSSFDSDGIYQVTGSSDVRIRCTPALNFNNSPQGSQGALYFHCNDGKLYALNATTGTLLWSANTGNNGGPPSVGDHQAWSSSPVIARSTGRIYVGSADGKVYGFAPTGTEILKVTIGLPIEASLAIGEQGWLYGATREQFDGRGKVFAVNPQAYVASNPSQAIVWEWLDPNFNTGFYLASPVIDQAGNVYMTQLGHKVYQVHAVTGGVIRSWTSPGIPGKLCQTPAINQYGQLFFGASVYLNGTFSYGAFCAIDLAVEGTTDPDWVVAQDSSGGSFGEFLGAVLIRGTSTGRVYFADTNGRLFWFNSNSPLMAGDWPCFQAGSRRTGYEGSWPFVLAQLPNFPNSYSPSVSVGTLNAWGEAVGAGWGSYNYPGTAQGGCAIRWQSQIITGYGGANAAVGSVAHAINNLGEAVGHWHSGWPSGPLAWPADFTLPYGQAVSLTVPLGYSLASARATDINGIGSIVGYATESLTGKIHLMRWEPDGANGWLVGEGYDTPAGGVVYGNAISLGSVVAGRGRFTVGGSLRAFVTGGTGTLPPSDIGTLGGLESEARDVHDEGGVTGWAHNSAGRQRPFLAPVTVTALAPAHELPPLNGTTITTYQGQGRAVNRHGQVVGRLQNNSLQYRAFRYTPGGYVSGGGSVSQDLNTLTLDNGYNPAYLGWLLTEAVSINDGEVMMGTGTYNGNSASWILYRKLTE